MDGNSPLQFPKQQDKNRIELYRHYDMLYYGKHFDAFGIKAETDFTKRYARMRYIAVNFPGIISRVMADMLFGENLTFDLENKETQLYVDEVLRRNQLLSQLYESALVNSRRGDTLFKMRVGSRHGGKPEIIIEEIPARYYYPELDERSNRNEPSKEIIAIPFKRGEKTYLLKETHTPGNIRYEVFEYDESKEEVISDVSAVMLPDLGLTDEETTGIERPLIFHIPNVRDGNGYFGTSDYIDLESLFFALNNRITKVDNILDKHSDPILAVPPGVLDDEGKVNKKHLGMFEVDNENPGFNKPEYIVWNANLESAFTQIDKLVDMLFMMSEIAPVSMGMDKQGRVESGRALKMKMLATIRKRNRKIRYFDQAIKDMIETAQQLAKINGIAKLPKVERPNITWGDGIVNDQVELVEIAQKRVEAGLSSRADEISRLDSVSPDDAKEKVKEIDAENTPTLPNIDDSNEEG